MKSLSLIFIVCGALHGMDNTEVIELKVIPNDAIGNQNLAWGYPETLRGCDKITQWEDRLKTAETTNNTMLALKTMHHINTEAINRQDHASNRGWWANYLIGSTTFILLGLHTFVFSNIPPN